MTNSSIISLFSVVSSKFGGWTHWYFLQTFLRGIIPYLLTSNLRRYIRGPVAWTWSIWLIVVSVQILSITASKRRRAAESLILLSCPRIHIGSLQPASWIRHVAAKWSPKRTWATAFRYSNEIPLHSCGEWCTRPFRPSSTKDILHCCLDSYVLQQVCS